ncbi:trehalose-phosphatase [Fodinicurvata halophila]|uniref:Trehalose 6-phosphate phosphatase n=1 Tax=Fodinicurvata halophila TaxID=1419723 RepID=A0ABV8UHE4_9PROT
MIRAAEPATQPPDAVPEFSGDWALFLDVDGSLLDIADHPGDVRADEVLVQSLACLRSRLCGALALISGRPLKELDSLFAPLHLPAAGQHGLERRSASGQLLPGFDLPEGFSQVESRLALFVDCHPELFLERKSRGLALHYRQAPELEREVLALAEALVPTCTPPLLLQRGKMVVELRVPGSNKGTAIAAFMAERPFAGRRPIFIGDDITDEDGFRKVNELDGHSVLVGSRDSAARWSIASAADLRRWLSQLASDVSSEQTRERT